MLYWCQVYNIVILQVYVSLYVNAMLIANLANLKIEVVKTTNFDDT